MVTIFLDKLEHVVINHFIGLSCNTKTQLFNKLIQFFKFRLLNQICTPLDENSPPLTFDI
jgi:hypothetical protein